MRNENLTRDEAATRSKLLKVESYDVHVDLTHAANQDFISYPTVTTVRFSARRKESTFIDYIHHSIDEVKLNGTHLDTAQVVRGSRIILPHLDDSNVLTIRGRSYFSRSGEGLHRYIDPGDGRVYLYTQYEPADCRRVFPNFEQPDLKAVFNFRVTAPKHWVVASNSELTRELEDPADSSITKRVFKATPPISTYITTILAGDYFVAHDIYTPSSSVNSGTIPLTAYCRKSLVSHFDHENIFSTTKKGLDFFQDLFDYPYPYPAYKQAFVPEYNLGAMENPGLVTFSEHYLFDSGATEAQMEGRANVIYHEMSHMWFGDLVTMKWWDDLWLKESFAEFMGTLAAREAGGFDQAWVTFANRRKEWAYAQDQLPTAHPIVAEVPNLEAAKLNFDGITYAKGSSVLKQLVAYLGFDTFTDAIRTYFKRFAWGNTELTDFLSVLDEVTDQDMFTWARAWLQTSGLSEISMVRSTDKSTAPFVLQQRLPVQVPPSLGRPHRLKYETFVVNKDRLVSTGRRPVNIEAGPGRLTPLRLTAAQRNELERADLLVLNAEDLTYAKARLGQDDGRDTALKLVSTVEDPLTRGLIWGSLWNQVRDAELSSSRFVHAVERSLSDERSATLLAHLLEQAQAAIFTYSPPWKRQGLSDSLYRAVEKALDGTEAGSDTQLIMVRSLLSLAAHTPLGNDFARAVAAGAGQHDEETPVLPGVPHSQALGWSALGALASRGETTVAQLERVKNSAVSTVAERGFAFATAALPTGTAKTAAYRSVVTQTDLSNEILTSTARGFQQGSEELHREFITPYFSDILTVWETRSIVMATRTVNGLFPRATLGRGQDPQENGVVTAAHAWLNDNPRASTALSRLIIENLDRAQRSLRAQKFNG